MNQHQQQAERQPQQGQVAHEPGGLLLQRRTFVFHCAQRGTDAADLASRACGSHTRQRVALHDQRARVDHRQIVAARYDTRGVGRPLRDSQFIGLRHPFAHRNSLARQQRFIGPHAVGRNQQGIGRHTVTLAQLEQVAAHHIAPGDALRLAVSDDQRARTREVAQSFDGALCLALLVQGEPQGDDHEPEERQSLLQVTEDEVEGSRPKQQKEHRLAHGCHGDRQQGAALAAGQRVGAVFGQAVGSLVC
ncbi:hypothetical protein FQZ97_746070 [compost metagenome]